ncbi:dihydroorotase [Burkholderiaceae bacterium FT117]|uniref:dihydroorotase n=1 Tax=Zeimonas sediminis TaxID=2944268 RepID=UPI002342D48E|nr:dihydroorotase [Zeimonas sediminis]MCM5572390.1 dihydroorotase [Zeimonas sediminis]
MKVSILNGRLVDPASGLDLAAGAASALHVADGRVVAIGDAPAGFAPDRTIDAAGCVVAPGLLDLAARLREPGYEYKATLESEMQAAIAGGITGLACPPDTDPTLDEPGLVEMLKYRARGIEGTRLFPVGSLTTGLKGEVITEMAELAEAGCVGFSQAMAPITDTQVLMRAMQYARTYGFTVWLHPQDPYLARGGVAHAGPYASRLGLPGVPVIAETVALNTIFDLVRVTGCRVHLCRLSSAAGLELVRRARAEGLPVSCDVAAHHIHLIDLDIGFFDANCRVDPPFRSQRDRDAIRAALADGTIDAICSDHTPVDDDAKQLPFGEAEPGVTGLELLLPLTLKWANEAGVPLATALAKISSGPAAVLGVPEATGRLEVGGPADLCVFDPREAWTVSRATLLSQGAHTPYVGRELEGRVRMTLVGGRVAWERTAGARSA